MSSCVTEKNELYKPKTEEICEKEFEKTRRCLLNLYHSYIQTHAAYIIAIAVGLFSLISNFDVFFKTFEGTIAFWLLMIFAVLIALRMTCRIFYWTSYATSALSIPMDEAIQLFREVNHKPVLEKPYLKNSPAPYSAILELAIWERRKKKSFLKGFLKRYHQFVIKKGKNG